MSKHKVKVRTKEHGTRTVDLDISDNLTPDQKDEVLKGMKKVIKEYGKINKITIDK